ncbi:MAG: hypothetical protein K2I95_06860 [Treponemataceae bacterium]|nr:hypothetical protein [Treponemataceae bacterium]
MFKVRKIFILLVAIFCAENLFAEYAGNLQIRAGASLEKLQRQNLKLNSQISDWSDYVKENCDGINFYLALSSYNIWYLHDGNFGIGFVVDIQDLIFYLIQSNTDVSTWDMMIDPAFGFRINNVVKMQTGIGVNVGFFSARYYGRYSSYYDTYVSDGDGFGLGVALDFNLEFLPNAFFSPVIGFRLGSIFSNGGHVHYESSSVENNQNNYDADYKIRNYSLRFYAGGAFNFGR